MSEWTIQMHWKCKHCGHVGPGLEGEDEGLRCSNCGSQKSDEDWIMPDDTSRAAAVTDPELLRRAHAGENWVCSFCRHEERNLHDKCSACGADRDTGVPTIPDSPRSIATSQISTTPPSPSPDTSRQSRRFQRSPKPWVPNGPLWTGKPRWHRYGSILLIALVAGAIVWGLIWLLTDRTATVRVQHMSWERTEVLEQRSTENGSGWGSPIGAFDVSCSQKLKEHRNCNPYDCNPRQVPYKCNCTGGETYKCNCRPDCRSNKNGSATCTEKCDTCTKPRKCQTCTRTEYDTCYEKCPVFDDYCSYKYYTWSALKRDKREGTDHAPVWPGLTTTSNTQRIQRSERYSVQFDGGDRNWTRTYPLQRFQRFRPGQRFEAIWNRGGKFELQEQL